MTKFLNFFFQQNYSHFLRASQNFPITLDDAGGDDGEDSGPEMDSCNLPLNLVATQLGSAETSQH